MSETRPESLDAVESERLLRYAGRTDLAPVVAALRTKRDTILSRWLHAVERQPFHLGRPERAISDEIPALFDALLNALPSRGSPEIPASDDQVAATARGHAHTRTTQGLQPGEVVLELRLLRHELLYALREQLSAEDGSDVLGAEILLGDALDGAIEIAVNYFIDALDEAKDDFVAIAAHDLRTPLTVLKGTVQMLRRQSTAGTLASEVLRQQLDVVEAEANRMDQLLGNLLDLTHVRAGRLEVRAAPVDLCGIVDHVVSRLSAAAQARIEIDRQAAPVIGNWEESRIEQVVENLLSNALKYAPSGSIRIVLSRGQSQARLEIHDDGIGLTPEEQSQLFRRFYRSPQAIERRVEGTGLGLYICRGIVGAHGGTIKAYSDGRDKGTTMIVTLPLDRAAETVPVSRPRSSV